MTDQGAHATPLSSVQVVLGNLAGCCKSCWSSPSLPLGDRPRSRHPLGLPAGELVPTLVTVISWACHLFFGLCRRAALSRP
jgi:hypothetical protein